MRKPEILFHASPNKDLNSIKPKNDNTRNPDNAGYVFAAKDFSLATCFLVPWDDSWVKRGRYKGNLFILISDRGKFLKLDQGGAIYTVPSKSFKCDTPDGMEWRSILKIKPIDKSIFDSGLKAMITHSVKVYFMQKSLFKKLIPKEMDEIWKELESLEPFVL